MISSLPSQESQKQDMMTAMDVATTVLIYKRPIKFLASIWIEISYAFTSVSAYKRASIPEKKIFLRYKFN